MTKLSKPLKREVSVSRIRRPVIVEIDPRAQKITLREKGLRNGYSIPILTPYSLLVRGETGEG